MVFFSQTTGVTGDWQARGQCAPYRIGSLASSRWPMAGIVEELSH